ncbi:unnamed protein product, partial [Amoebophrya sp. A25]
HWKPSNALRYTSWAFDGFPQFHEKRRCSITKSDVRAWYRIEWSDGISRYVDNLVIWSRRKTSKRTSFKKQLSNARMAFDIDDASAFTQSDYNKLTEKLPSVVIREKNPGTVVEIKRKFTSLTFFADDGGTNETRRLAICHLEVYSSAGSAPAAVAPNTPSGDGAGPSDSDEEENQNEEDAGEVSIEADVAIDGSSDTESRTFLMMLQETSSTFRKVERQRQGNFRSSNSTTQSRNGASNTSTSTSTLRISAFTFEDFFDSPTFEDAVSGALQVACKRHCNVTLTEEYI